MKILVIEDEKKVSAFIKKGLEEQGFEAVQAFDGEVGLRLAAQTDFDVILLDVILPGMNGFQTCEKLRSHLKSKTPILMLTALGATDDIILGLETGADDYITKPFKFRELVARIKALSRRSSSQLVNSKIGIADLEVDMDSKVVLRDNESISLTAREFNLLVYFLRNQGKVVSRADILENVWEINFDLGTNVVDVYVNYLRNKIDRNFSPKLIHTAVGMGYVLKEK